MKNPSPAEATAVIILLLAIISIAFMGSEWRYNAMMIQCGNYRLLMASRNGITVTIYFMHSVHKTPEVDVIEYTGNGFRLVAMGFQEYGAGVPESPESINGTILDTSGGFIVYQNGSYTLAHDINYNLRDIINPQITIGGLIVAGEECEKLSITGIG